MRFVVPITALAALAALCLSLAAGRAVLTAVEIGLAVGAIASGACLVAVAFSRWEI